MTLRDVLSGVMCCLESCALDTITLDEQVSGEVTKQIQTSVGWSLERVRWCCSIDVLGACLWRPYLPLIL